MTTLNLGDLERNKFYHPGVPTQQFGLNVVTNHMYQVAQGGTEAYSFVNKFGRAIAVGTSIVDVDARATPAVYTWLQAAVQLEAISSSVNDIATTGTGARTIRVLGKDANFVDCSADIAMNGTSASSATTQTFRRIERAYVLTSGRYAKTDAGSHVGTITIRTSGAGAIHLYIPITPALGQSLAAKFTIPSGYTGYLHHAFFSVDSLKKADFYLFRRTNADAIAAPYGAQRIVETFNGVSAPFPRSWEVPIKFAEKTDIWVSCIAAAAATNVSASFDILMIKDVR